MSVAELLVEIGTEEIPARALAEALPWLCETFTREVTAAGLAGDGFAVATYATPRRMAMCARGVLTARPERREERTGPRRSACFDAAGRPTRALEGFAKGAGVAVETVTFREEGKKGEIAVAQAVVPGQDAAELLVPVLGELLRKLPSPKSMRWVPGSDARFCRPLRSLVVLLGERSLELRFADVVSGREVAGHPFLAPGRSTLASASFSAYRAILESRKVMLDGDERRRRIRAEVAAACAPLRPELDEGLLDEVVNLVEWPGVVVGSFDEDFLQLPEEVIIEPMKVQQRYFPVRDETGRLVNRFAVVHNRGGNDGAKIAAGNARVLRARLSDARFFFANDRKRSLESRLGKLEGMLFRKDQGTMRQKAARLEALARRLAETLRAAAVPGIDTDVAARAGLLAKADHGTDIVYEFPALQGTMGRIYAGLQGEPPELAAALGAQYGPRADGPLPREPVSLCLCLADKLDSLVSATLAQGLATGNRDPFATRRDAIAVLRLLGEGLLGDGIAELRLDDLFSSAAEGYAGIVKVGWSSEHQATLLAFVQERLRVMLRDAGEDHDLVAAVLATDAGDVAGVRRRLAALRQVAATPAWPLLVEAVERTANITRTWTPPADWGAELRVSAALLQEEPEKDLHSAWQRLLPIFQARLAAGDAAGASAAYAEALAAPLGTFFDKVFVNHADPGIKNNRMALLRSVHRLYAAHIADLSKVSLKRDR